MNAKALLIPLAAFAVTATGVSAFNSQVLEDAGLSGNQISAFEEAHERRKEGDRDGARGILEGAGIDLETLENIREAHREYRHGHQEAIHSAVEANDYGAFKDAIEDSPLKDIITTESDFDKFVEAYTLREEGEYDAAKDILTDLGIERHHGVGGHGRGHGSDEPRGFGGQ